MPTDTLLFLDCPSGISGDMVVAALLDLGADPDVLAAALESLPLDGFRIETAHVRKAGLACCDFRVLLDAAHENHDHDMDWLHGHDHDGHHHHHDGHHNDHDGHGHPHEHRGLAEIRSLLAGAALTERARDLASSVFDVLARAEAKAHGTSPEEVHFHEVGAVDSIVDIVSAAVCLDSLGVRRVAVSDLFEGTGTVRCQHGILPVPVPAVTHIAQEAGLVLRVGPVPGEFVTPTGAAIAAAWRTDALPERFRILRTGLGAGKREYARPSFLRALLLEPLAAESDSDVEVVSRLECDIDDASGEELAFAAERLRTAGALEVDYAPLVMKKGRPGWRLAVLCRKGDEHRFSTQILAQTSTLGVRWVEMRRRTARREMRSVSTPWGDIPVKVSRKDGAARPHPEYEAVAAAARAANVPFRRVHDAAVAAFLALGE